MNTRETARQTVHADAATYGWTHIGQDRTDVFARNGAHVVICWAVDAPEDVAVLAAHLDADGNRTDPAPRMAIVDTRAWLAA